MEHCAGVIPNTFIACGEGGNFCSESCLQNSVNVACTACRGSGVERFVDAVVWRCVACAGRGVIATKLKEVRHG